MSDLLKDLILGAQGGVVGQIFVLALIAIILYSLGHFAMKFFKFLVNDVYPKIKKTNDIEYNKIYEDHLKEKIIVLIDEKLESLKDYKKIFEDNYEDNVINIVNERQNEANSQLAEKIHKIYETLTDLREKYAGKMATREDLEKVNNLIRGIENELSKIKGKIGID